MAFSKAAIEKRRAAVADLLRTHHTEAAIARQLGASERTIAYDVAALRAEYRERRAIDTDAWVDAELERLGRAERAIWPQIEAGKLVAIDRLLAILERRARYLGLDAQPAGPEGAGRLSVSVVYIGANGDPVGPPPGTIISDGTGDPLQRRLLRAPLGEDGPGD